MSRFAILVDNRQSSQVSAAALFPTAWFSAVYHADTSISAAHFVMDKRQATQVTAVDGDAIVAFRLIVTSFPPDSWNSRRCSSQRKTARITTERQHGMDRPVTVVAAAHRRRQKRMGSHHIRGICRSTPQRRRRRSVDRWMAKWHRGVTCVCAPKSKFIIN